MRCKEKRNTHIPYEHTKILLKSTGVQCTKAIRANYCYTSQRKQRRFYQQIIEYVIRYSYRYFIYYHARLRVMLISKPNTTAIRSSVFSEGLPTPRSKSLIVARLTPAISLNSSCEMWSTARLSFKIVDISIAKSLLYYTFYCKNDAFHKTYE